MGWSDFYMDTAAGSNLNAGSTAGSPVYTSTSGNFDGTSVYTPTDGQTTNSLVNVGDWCSIYPTANATTPFIAQVTVVGTGVNGTITVSTTIKYGTAPGAVACKARTGGAWANLGMLASGVALNTGTVPVSTRVNILAGTYANTTTSRTFALTGTAILGLWWRGYKATIGDQDANNLAVAGTDIPAITFTTGAAAVGGRMTFSSLDVSGATLNVLWNNGASSSGCRYYRFRCQNTASNSASTAFGVSSNGGNITCESCYFKSTVTATTCVSAGGSAPASFVGCVFTTGSINLTIASGTSACVAFCVFDSAATDAIKVSTATALYALNCSFYAPGGNGINFSAAPLMALVQNCYFEAVNQAAKSAINNTTGTDSDLIRCVANTYFNCTATLTGITETFSIFDNGTLASAGFNPQALNYSVVPIAWRLGYPGLFENVSLYRGYLDAGAVQHLDSSVVNQTINRYIVNEGER